MNERKNVNREYQNICSCNWRGKCQIENLMMRSHLLGAEEFLYDSESNEISCCVSTAFQNKFYYWHWVRPQPSLIHSVNLTMHWHVITNSYIYVELFVLHQASHHSNVAKLKCENKKMNSLKWLLQWRSTLELTCILAQHMANCLLSTKHVTSTNPPSLALGVPSPSVFSNIKL